MYFDEVMQKFRESYKTNKDTKLCLVHDNNGTVIEFFPQLDDELIQYHVIKGENLETNSTVGYVEHLDTELLLSNNWSLCEVE